MAGLIGRQIRQDRLNRALIMAVEHDDSAAVASLLQRGADANACEPARDPVLPWRRLLDCLIGRQIQPSARRSALLVAIEGSYYPKFPVSLEPADPRLVAILLHSGANPDTRDEAGRPALLAAALNADRRVVLLLLSHGARADMRLHNGDTLLMTIVGAGVTDASILRAIAGRSELDARNQDGQTALTTARISGNTEAVRLLSAVRADSQGRGAVVPVTAFRGSGGSG
jgi:ankyrin repeat protein